MIPKSPFNDPFLGILIIFIAIPKDMNLPAAAGVLFLVRAVAVISIAATTRRLNYDEQSLYSIRPVRVIGGRGLWPW
jgi:hypothetical protein